MFCLDQEATFDRKPDTGGEDVVRLFAVLHDCRRENDGADPGRGPRAADYAKSLRAQKLFEPVWCLRSIKCSIQPW